MCRTVHTFMTFVQRVATAQARVEHMASSMADRATRVAATAKYPGKERLPDYVSVFDGLGFAEEPVGLAPQDQEGEQMAILPAVRCFAGCGWRLVVALAHPHLHPHLHPRTRWLRVLLAPALSLLPTCCAPRFAWPVFAACHRRASLALQEVEQAIDTPHKAHEMLNLFWNLSIESVAESTEREQATQVRGRWCQQ